MRKHSPLILAVVAALIGWFVVQSGGLKGLKLPFDLPFDLPTANAPPPPRGNETIRIASFNIQVFGESKLQNPRAMQAIVAILKQFDVVAIQEVRAESQEIMPRLIALLNADGQFQYDYVIGPRLGRTASKEQYAFVFDMATIEVDRSQLYTLDDPDDLLHREPLVGWFRARGPEAGQAFTFSLANVHTDPDEVGRELDALQQAFFAVRDDGRMEDDVIMLGDFNAAGDKLKKLGQIGGLERVIVGKTPTNTRGTDQYDNILFHSTATTEYTGRGGVYDFLREPQNNFTLEQALEISDHLPIWAEFSVFEGGRPGPVATAPGQPASGF